MGWQPRPKHHKIKAQDDSARWRGKDVFEKHGEVV